MKYHAVLGSFDEPIHYSTIGKSRAFFKSNDLEECAGYVRGSILEEQESSNPDSMQYKTGVVVETATSEVVFDYGDYTKSPEFRLCPDYPYFKE